MKDLWCSRMARATSVATAAAPALVGGGSSAAPFLVGAPRRPPLLPLCSSFARPLLLIASPLLSAAVLCRGPRPSYAWPDLLGRLGSKEDLVEAAAAVAGFLRHPHRFGDRLAEIAADDLAAAASTPSPPLLPLPPWAKVLAF